MRLLLDTHTLLWALADPDALSAEARAAIEDGDNEVVVSAASAWEISIKQALGRLDAPADLVGALESVGFVPLPMGMRHALDAGRLPPLHHDPFDRMLVAQAIAEGLTLVTRDERLARYGVAVMQA